MIKQRFTVPGKEPREAFAKVHRVLDGDTVDVRTREGVIRIRLDAIDCPEDGQPWGDTATAGLIKMIGGREIRLEIRGQDQYGRSLGTIFVEDKDTSDWTNVNARMVMLGHAWVYRQFCSHLPRNRQGELYRMERWARSREVGLWRAGNPVPPWQWRNGIAPPPKRKYETELVNDRLRLRERDLSVGKGGRDSSQNLGDNGSGAAVWIFAIVLALVFVGIASWSYFGEDSRSRSGPWSPVRSQVAKSPAILGSESPAPKQSTCRIKGNINWQGERIYYVPGTSFYETAVINPDNGERWFCSEQEATAAGWRAPRPVQPVEGD